MIGPLFDMFTGAMFIFSSVKFLNMSKPRTGWPTSIGILWNWASNGECRLMLNADWRWWMQTDSVPSDQKFSCKWNLSFFKAVPSYRQSFHLGSPLHIISSSLSHFCLIQCAILHKLLKLGFWNFKPIFLRMQFSLVATFFSLVLIISLSWYFHLPISCLTLVTWHFGSKMVFPNIYKTTKWLVWT